MLQLTCLLDGGLCLLALVFGPTLVGWLGYKLKCSKSCRNPEHHHEP